MRYTPRCPRSVLLSGLLLSGLLAATGCLERGPRSEVRFPPGGMALDSTGSRPRLPLPVTLTAVRTVGGASREDTTLVNPYLMAADRDRVYLLEDDQRVVCVDTSGAVLWRAGKAGGGPGEFRNVRDMKVAEDGSLWLLDPSSARITVLGRSGAVSRMFPLQHVAHSERIVPLPGGGFVLFPFEGPRPVMFFSATNDTVASDTLGWSGFRDLEPLTRTFLTAVDPVTGHWAAAFTWGNGWFGFDRQPGSGSPRRYFVEPTRFPPIVRQTFPDGAIGTGLVRTHAATLDLAVRSDTVYVLFDGDDPGRRQKLDLYQWESGNYLGTVRLPGKADNIGFAGRYLVTYYSDPIPKLTFYRLTETPAAGSGGRRGDRGGRAG